MNPDPLSELRDWHLPDPVSWWPPAPGWWLLVGLLLAGVWFVIRGWRRWRRQGAGTRLALRELAGLNAALATDGDARRFIAGVSQLLRRLALVRFPCEQVAGLSGSDWLTFLDATGGGSDFTQGPGRILIESAYRPELARSGGFDPEPLSRLAAIWIRTNGRATSRRSPLAGDAMGRRLSSGIRRPQAGSYAGPASYRSGHYLTNQGQTRQ